MLFHDTTENKVTKNIGILHKAKETRNTKGL